MRGPGAAIATLIFALAIAAGAFALPKDAELGRMAADGPVTLSSSRPASPSSTARTSCPATASPA